MDRPDELIAALVEEDRLLRERLLICPPDLREQHGSGGSLSFKETLGHLAFWDTFAVRFFRGKLDDPAAAVSSPVNFEERSREELDRIRQMPFAEVQELYRQATMGLLEFLRTRWQDLSEKERQDFTVPLKHRRHHRLLLDRALGPHLLARGIDELEGKA